MNQSRKVWPMFAPIAGGWDALANEDAVAEVVDARAQGFAFADPPTSQDVAAAISARARRRRRRFRGYRGRAISRLPTPRRAIPKRRPGTAR